MLKKMSVCALTVGLFAMTAQAAIVDVAAVGGPGGNVLNSATNSDSDYWAPANNSSDDLWSPNSGAMLSHTASNDDSPELKQTFSGLDPTRIYDIYVKGLYYWNDSIAATSYYAPAGALEGDSVQTYLGVEGTGALTPVYLLVGQVQGTNSVTVIYDDFDVAAVDAHTGGLPKRANRTYILGLGYEDVGAVPEPASLGLLAAGLGLLSLRRRA